MTDHAMIERIARYLCRVSYIEHESPDRDGPEIDRHVEEMWSDWTDEARELLGIMREPDDAMTEASLAAWREGVGPADLYKLMIDEAAKR
jgi:hypothetical protein